MARRNGLLWACRQYTHPHLPRQRKRRNSYNDLMSTSIAEPRWYHIGPHGFYDLVRLARRGRSTLVRVAYVLTLFAALAVVYYQTHETRTDSRFDFGDIPVNR